jgi:hypothetical protein
MAGSLEAVPTQEYWRALAPSFHIADSDFLSPNVADASIACMKAAEDIATDGYTQLRGIDLAADFEKMAGVVRTLVARDLEAVFCFVYDEFWRPYFRLDALYRHLLGPYTFLPDFWAWDIDPKRGGEGWKRHRDRGRQSLRADGSPISLTTWIAVSEATAENGCLRMVPKHADPTYNTPHENTWQFEEQNVRVLPARPGDVLMWNQAVTHWGGKAEPDASHSRISLSFETQRLDVPSTEAPLIAPWQILSFEQRLRLIAEKLLHYRHMNPLTPALEALAQELAG